MSRVAFVGSRSWNDERAIGNRIADLDDGDVVVTGGARGADRLAAKRARARGLIVALHLPDWRRHGLRAAFIRNQAIVDDCDRLVAFWDGESRGTADVIERARKAGKPVHVVTRAVGRGEGSK